MLCVFSFPSFLPPPFSSPAGERAFAKCSVMIFDLCSTNKGGTELIGHGGCILQAGSAAAGEFRRSGEGGGGGGQGKSEDAGGVRP